jgi:hypothetical protein
MIRKDIEKGEPTLRPFKYGELRWMIGSEAKERIMRQYAITSKTELKEDVKAKQLEAGLKEVRPEVTEEELIAEQDFIHRETQRFPTASEKDNQIDTMMEMGLTRLEAERANKQFEDIFPEERDMYNSLPKEQQIKIAKTELPKEFGEKNTLVTREEANQAIVELRRKGTCK